MTQTTSTTPTHDGPCLVDLDIHIASTGLTPRKLAERALIWADGIDEFAELIPMAREALDAGRGKVKISRELFDALSEVVTEFGQYAALCGYYDDEDEEDRRIARCLIEPTFGRVNTWLLCECPVTWTETTTFCRYGEDRSETTTRQAGAHI